MAVKFLEFLASKEVHAELADHMGKLPLRTDVTAEELNIEAGTVYEQMYEAAQGYVFWVDNLLKPDVAARLMAMSAQVVIGQMTLGKIWQRTSMELPPRQNKKKRMQDGSCMCCGRPQHCMIHEIRKGRAMKIKESRMLRREKYQAWLSTSTYIDPDRHHVRISARADSCHKLYTMEQGRRP